MARYILRRLFIGFITLIGISLITFVVIQLAPGNPVMVKLYGVQNKSISKRVEKQLMEYYGLDKPIPVQYLNWMKRLATGDLGNSMSDGNKVSRKIKEAIWPTISVELLAILISLIIAVPIGIYMAMRQGGAFDAGVSTLLYVIYSIPSYVIGMILILYLGVKWDLLPFRGMRSDEYETLSTMGKVWDVARHYVMITACFTVGELAYYCRFVRQNLLEVIRQDYVRTARAKGLGEANVVVRHAFVNTLIPFITLLGLTFPALIGGSVILETMFNWPGLGRLYMDSVLQRDYPTIMALNFFTALMVLVGTLLADLAYGLVDPRVTYE